MKRKNIIDQFAEFLTDNYYKDIALAASQGKKSLQIDISLLDKLNPDLADMVLDDPKKAIEIFEESLEQIDVPGKKELRIRLFNMPESGRIRIRNIRSEHIGKFICVDGVVKRASEVRPEVAETIFECPECGEKITVIQTEQNKMIQYPTKCDCGCRRGFRLTGQKLFDARWIAIEEPFEITTGERPSEVNIFLKEDLTSPEIRNKTDPGNRIRVLGVLKEIPRKNIRGMKSRQLEILLDANNIESVETEWEDISIDSEDEKKIKEFAKDPEIYNKLITSLAPTMYGLEKLKLAIIFQLFGGVTHLLKDGTRIRGDIHLLCIGDPSTGKSQLLKLSSDLMPRGKYVSGKGVTGAGLTASVVKDEQFLGGWVLEAGALVLANRSIISIDEFEKMDRSDQIAMHEAMSLQQISIAKASIVATLPARTSVLAGANPKLGRFDPYIPIREQVDVPETLLSRFDVKFALRDVPNPEIDEKMVDHVLKARHFEQDKVLPTIDPAFLKKYITYAKVNCKPELTKEAGKKLKDFYVNLRSRSSGEEAPIPITLRQYEALIRLSEASAKIRLGNKVLLEDADRAIDIMKYSLRQFGFDPETGLIDIDRAEGATTSAQRSKIRIVLDIIDELQSVLGKNIPVDEIARRAKEQGVERVDDILTKMKNEGMVFEPKHGIIQKV